MTLSGFLGAGKTTTLVAAAKYLQATGRKVAVITNDQGSELVDTQLTRSDIDEVGEVTGGCFCCRFEDLLTVAKKLVDDHGAETLLAEAVGSCTDLQATVVRPLRKYYSDRIAASPLVTVVEADRLEALRVASTSKNGDSDLSYLFSKQLEEADIIALNKIDLLDESAIAAILKELRNGYPSATVLGYSAKTGEGLEALVGEWTGDPPEPRDISIDYGRYAKAEAALAWLNQTLTVTAFEGFDANTWARTLLECLSKAAANRGWTLGHAKVSVRSADILTKFSLTASGAEPTGDVLASALLTDAAVCINARVACEPTELDDALREAIDAACAATSASAQNGAGEPAFQPDYPQPTYRLAATDQTTACSCGGSC